MRLLTVLAVLLLAAAGTGCGGGDDETSGDTDPVVTETTGTETTDDTDTTDDTGDGFASDECAELAAATTAFSEAFGGGSPSDAVDETSAFFDETADTAPEEIRDDLEVLGNAFAEYADVLEEAGIEPGETPDPQTLAALTSAIARIDQEGVAEASENVSTWAADNC